MKKKLLIAAVVIGLLSAIIFVMNQPTRGTVTPITTKTEATKEEDASEWETARQKAIEQTKLANDKAIGIVGSSTYTGKQFSFSYPNTFIIKTQEVSESGVLEKVILLDSGSTAQKIVATATQMPAISSLDEVPAVQMRRLNTTRYSEKTASASGALGVRFDKKENGYEAIDFFLQNYILFTIAFTTPSNDPKLDDLFDTILTSFKLK